MSDFVHMELATPDVAAAKAFYAKLFGWKMKDTPMPGGTYTIFDTGGKGPHGGLTTPMMPEQPTGWLAYIGVKSLKATIAKAKSLGAKVYVEHQEVPGMGSLGVFADPTGATIAVWEPAPMPPPPKKAPKKKAAKKAAKKVAKKAPAKKTKNR